MTAVAEETSKSTVSHRGEAHPASSTGHSREAIAMERSLIDASTRGPVLTFFTTAVGWLLFATLLNLITAIQLHSPGFLAGVPCFTYGRIFPAAHNAFVYGWCSLAGAGVAIWLMARLCRVSVRAPGVLVFGALIWNLGLAAGIIAIMAGSGRGLEGMELPATCHWLMFAGFTLIGLWAAVLFRFRRESVAFISAFYILGAMFWFPWLLATANVVANLHEVRGVMKSVVAAWFTHGVDWWWLTSIGIAAAYFLIPKTINRPVQSYSLAPLGFWTFAFLSGLTSMVRLNGGPVPVWLVTVSIAASIMLLVPIATIVTNLAMTMRGHTNAVYHSPTVRFTWFGVIAFAIAGLLSVIGSLRSVDRVVHFTLFNEGVQSLLLYSFFSMVMFGAFYYITPRLVDCEWLSSSMISIHFWGAAYGGSFAAALLIFSGVAQGGALVDPNAIFSQAVQVAQVYFPGRTIALLLLSFGHIVFALHFLLMLLRIGQPGGEPTLFAVSDETHH